MVDGIDGLDWLSLGAPEAPALLRDLARGKKRVIGRLREVALQHGSPTAAGAAIARFLVELVSIKEARVKVLDLLIALVEAEPHYVTSRRLFGMLGMAPADASERAADDRKVAEIADVLAWAVPSLLALLDDPSSAVRGRVVRMLGRCPKQAAVVAAPLSARLEAESMERIRAGLLLALARVGAREMLEPLTRASKGPMSVVTFAAAVGRVLLEGEATTEEAVGRVLAHVPLYEQLERVWTPACGELPIIDGDLALAAASVRVRSAALIRALASVRGYGRLELILQLVADLFPVASAPPTLDDERRSALRLFADAAEADPTIAYNLKLRLPRRGLPVDSSALRALAMAL